MPDTMLTFCPGVGVCENVDAPAQKKAQPASAIERRLTRMFPPPRRMPDQHASYASGASLVKCAYASTLMGRVRQTLAPRGELPAAHKRPPCDSTIDRLMLSPMPVPSGLVVKNALKIRSACCGGSPTPVSLTDTRTCSFSAR